MDNQEVLMNKVNDLINKINDLEYKLSNDLYIKETDLIEAQLLKEELDEIKKSLIF